VETSPYNLHDTYIPHPQTQRRLLRSWNPTMIFWDFFGVCIICGVVAVSFSNLVNYPYRHEGISRLDEISWQRQR